MALHWQLVRADVAAVLPKVAKLEPLEIARSAQALVGRLVLVAAGMPQVAAQTMALTARQKMACLRRLTPRGSPSPHCLRHAAGLSCQRMERAPSRLQRNARQ